MKTNSCRLILLILFVIVLRAEAASSTPQAKGATNPHTFGWKGEHFLLDGQPFQILSGEMHYARVPRACWRRRMRLMKAMGLNTLTTYVFWNLHEPKSSEFNFSDNLDIAAFIRIAQEEGLWVILRPGPYICSEWEFGGFPARGSQKLAEGTLPDVLSAINFGASDSPQVEFDRLEKFRRDVPKMCGEFWVGWFDAWGQKHHSVGVDSVTKGLEWMLSRGISVNLYMFHGGTTFGWMNGANQYEAYTADISSYDYDSPVDEAGRPTPKFFALQDVIKKFLPASTVLPEVPAPESMITIPRFELSRSASLFANLREPIHSNAIKTMEDLGQAYGFILYRTRLSHSGKGVLKLIEPRDYATVYQRSKRLGNIDRRENQNSLQADFDGSQPLDILVENMGRINFGPHLVDDRKGISDKAILNGKELTGWDIFALPLIDVGRLKFSSTHQAGPAFHRGTFALKELGDTYLDMRGWGKGFVWVNGQALGRYWSIGPQKSLFVPANWLRVGQNDVIVFDYEERGDRSLAGIEKLVFETPAREVGPTAQ